jgi:hypothetical protein
MGDPIEVNYIPDGDDWTVTAKGRGQTLTGRAPGLIAARDRADQLVEKLAPDEEHRTVVHLLKGDAVEFTTAYLTARLAKPEPVAVVEVPVEAPVNGSVAAATEPAKAEPANTAARPQAADPAKPSPTPRPGPRPGPPPSAQQAVHQAAQPTPQPAAQPGPQPEKSEEPASP